MIQKKMQSGYPLKLQRILNLMIVEKGSVCIDGIGSLTVAKVDDEGVSGVSRFHIQGRDDTPEKHPEIL